MIEYLRGVLLKTEPGHVIIDVNGVGYGVDIPTSYQNRGTVGDAIELHIYFYVQEQIIRLYGFNTEQERDVFVVFLGISGIGPRTAMGILSAIEIGQFARAVVQNDIRTLTQLPGIGKKTAERLVLELREKMAGFTTASAATVGTSTAIAGGSVREAIEAMQALGCKPAVAERAVMKATEILGSEAETSALLKEALKHRH